MEIVAAVRNEHLQKNCVQGTMGSHTICGVYIRVSCSFLLHYHHSLVNLRRVERRGWT